ncbi:PA14 domain-containing protein [Puniceicoccus vermicola]|uniref:PA14 domain-containing protein n=1 Tax=Puniceicoccus vermicola TaxID=388746 RepID=A0A7X1E6S2_9BACT|nr:PA14 domain-containing protein [Puniceicoccus vermicola]MBC2602947.1 hypothetical protein [Puniceicoccus vermicola]
MLFRFLTSLSLCLTLTPAFAQLTIPYFLEKDSRVSLAIYDSEGKMVRTLRNADPQPAGANTVFWDGLDPDGHAVPAGDYTWKLLSTQGMKAEFLVNLGVSTGIDFWVGQHGGPACLAVDGDSFYVAGKPEGVPMLIKAKLSGGSEYFIDQLETTAPEAICVDNGKVHALLSSGMLYTLDAATGEKILRKGLPYPGGAPLVLPVRELEPIPPTVGEKSVRIPAGPGRYLLSLKIGQANADNAPFTMDGDFRKNQFPTTLAGEFETIVSPPQYRTFNPLPTPESGVFEQTFRSLSKNSQPWAVADMKLLTVPDFIDARFGELIACYPALGTVAWIDPVSADILATAQLPEGKTGRAVLVAPGTALVASGNELISLTRDGQSEVKATGLTDVTALAFDPSNGGFWVADGGTSQQVKFFDSDFKLQKTFGREGGRQTGIYHPENFLQISAIAADGKGGFLITESKSAPRRTVHFSADGEILREWLGGQQFYTFAAPDPENPDILWMDSSWGWIMQVQVDWDQRTWKVLATYEWGEGYSSDFVNPRKMAQRHTVKRLDLDHDGKNETYLYGGNMGLLKVDEAAGKLRLVSVLDIVRPTENLEEWRKTSVEDLPKPWLEAIALAGDDPETNFSLYRSYGWADANGDYEMQANEFRLARRKKDERDQRGSFGILDDLSVLKRGSRTQNRNEPTPFWTRYPLQGYTASGSPIWDWAISEPLLPPTASTDIERARAVFVAPSGDIYQLIQGLGDGYYSIGTYNLGHGSFWPANKSSAVGVQKWNPEGELLWQVAPLASRQERVPGKMQHPLRFAGMVNGTIGVCDKVVNPVEFWTEDGLYAGGLFDRRADDGLPIRVYSWWIGGTRGYEADTGQALLQYDMNLGGSLIERENGEVIFVGSGWNSCPAYRVTGWDNFERQEGTLKISAPAGQLAAQDGIGLRAEFFASETGNEQPVLETVSPRLWFEPNRAEKRRMPEVLWPEKLTASIPQNEDFTARWSGYLEPRFTEDYTLALYKKEGIARVWIDGELVVETTDSPRDKKAFSQPIPFRAGKKVPIRVEWKGTPADELHLSWESLSQPIEHVPSSALYTEK